MVVSYYTGNYWLNMEEMKVNADWLYGALTNEGWTLNAIAGFLGNTQTESHHNPGIWQNLAEGKGPGYGLTQWTPYTKYTNWCAAQGLEPSTMEAAIARIKYEIDHPNEQWVKHTNYPLTFKQFTQSNETPYYLAMTFLNNYEMPGDLNQPARGEQANFWYEYLSGHEPPDPGPGPGPTPGFTYRNNRSIIPLILRGYYQGRR